jgi:site-specific DNA recombinase
MQRTRCRALCEARGWEVAAEFEDEGLTGRNMDRPGLQAMLRAAADGDIEVVVVYRLDRLARKSRHLQEIWEDHLAKHGVELASTTESIDTSNPMGRAMMQMVGVMAQLESEMIQERTSDGRREKAQQGGFGLAVRSYGFKWDKGDKDTKRPKRPMIIEAEAEVVRTIFDMAAGGHSVEGICKTLHRQGVPRRKGGKWWNPEVQEILANPAYMGRFVTWRDPETGEETLADPRLCPPAIVDEAVWQAAQAVTRAYRGHRRPWVKRTFLLSGFCTCGKCGRTLTIRQPDEKHAYYACNGTLRGECDAKHVPAGGLDEKVWGFVRSLQDDPEMVKAYARQTTEDLLPKWERELVRVGEQLKHWRNRERTAREKLETGVYSDDDYRKTKAEYDLHWGDLQAEAAALEEKITHARQERADVDWTAEVLRRAGDLDALDLDGKRRLLSALGATVTVITVKDERGRLADVKAKLETYAAPVPSLASAGAMF